MELVGALRFNSVYRDRETGSWWYQADGQAAVGPLVGKILPQILADHMTLEQWLALYPDSDVMQPDAASAEGYKLFNYDRFDASRSSPDRPLEWQWVLSLGPPGSARAYPWSVLSGEGLLQDDLHGAPIAIHVLADSVSYRVWDRREEGRVLDFRLTEEDGILLEAESGTLFGFDGFGRQGALAGLQLTQLKGDIEYRHSFETFTGGEIYSATGEEANPGG